MTSRLPTDNGVDYTSVGSIFTEGGEGSDHHFFRTYSSAAEGNEPYSFEAYTILDFEPGVDRLAVEADSLQGGGIFTSATLSKITSYEGYLSTTLTRNYESEGNPSAQMVVNLNSADVTWNDIELPDGVLAEYFENADDDPVLTLPNNGSRLVFDPDGMTMALSIKYADITSDDISYGNYTPNITLGDGDDEGKCILTARIWMAARAMTPSQATAMKVRCQVAMATI